MYIKKGKRRRTKFIKFVINAIPFIKAKFYFINLFNTGHKIEKRKKENIKVLLSFIVVCVKTRNTCKYNNI